MEVLLDGEQSEKASNDELSGSGDAISFIVDEDHTMEAFIAMNHLRLSHSLCDVVLVAGGSGGQQSEVYAHKVVLASRSRYFEAMFTSGMLESRERRVEIKDAIDPSSLRSLVDFIYTGKLAIDTENAQALLSASAFLHVTAAREACERFLSRQLDPCNCLGIRAYAHEHACQELVRKCDEFFWANFSAVVKEDEYLLLPVDALMKLLASDELNVASEKEVFDAVVRWMKYDGTSEKRDDCMANLLSQVRLQELPIDYLTTVVEKDSIIRQNLECRDLVDRAKNHYLLSKMRRTSVSVLDADTEQPRPRKSTVGNVYAIGGRGKLNEPYKTVEMYDFFRDKWSEVVALNSRRRHVGVTAVDGKVYAVGGHDGELHLNSVECFHPETGKWTEIEPMLTKRRGAAVGSLGGPLYAAGGLNDTECFNTVERYNPHAREWKTIASMRSPRGGVGVTELDCFLYAVGGNNGLSSLGSVERYDPHVDAWFPVRDMLVKRAGVGVTSAGGRVYAVGGFDDSAPLASAEAFDPREGRWTLISRLTSARGGVGAVHFGCWIAAVGGHDGNCYLNSVEILDVYKNEWFPAASMANSRAGAGVACC